MTEFDHAVTSRQAKTSESKYAKGLQIDIPSFEDGKSAKPTPTFDDLISKEVVHKNLESKTAEKQKTKFVFPMDDSSVA